jgi:hypothetical protein
MSKKFLTSNDERKYIEKSFSQSRKKPDKKRYLLLKDRINVVWRNR